MVGVARGILRYLFQVIYDLQEEVKGLFEGRVSSSTRHITGPAQVQGAQKEDVKSWTRTFQVLFSYIKHSTPIARSFNVHFSILEITIDRCIMYILCSLGRVAWGCIIYDVYCMIYIVYS